MRYPRFLPASLLVLFISFTLGCGSPSHNPNATRGIFKVSSSSPAFIAALLPNSAPVNSVPFTIEVNGANFDTAAVVFWNGTPLFTKFVNSQQLLCRPHEYKPHACRHSSRLCTRRRSKFQHSRIRPALVSDERPLSMSMSNIEI